MNRPTLKFDNRAHAGRELGRKLGTLPRNQLIILGLPRGGVPVAYEVARALDAPLDVLPVRKLGSPQHREYAIGALATAGVEVFDERSIAAAGVSDQALSELVAREKRELDHREQFFRRGREPLSLSEKAVVLVDDGMATGATMVAAVRAAGKLGADNIVVAVPTGSQAAVTIVGAEANDVLCLSTPDPYYAVGYSYHDFSQVPDDEVARLLALRDEEIAVRASLA